MFRLPIRSAKSPSERNQRALLRRFLPLRFGNGRYGGVRGGDHPQSRRNRRALIPPFNVLTPSRRSPFHATDETSVFTTFQTLTVFASVRSVVFNANRSRRPLSPYFTLVFFSPFRFKNFSKKFFCGETFLDVAGLRLVEGKSGRSL